MKFCIQLPILSNSPIVLTSHILILMPVKMKRKSQPPRKRPQKVLADKNICNEEKTTFGEPISLRMMKEMDVMPLDDDSYFDNFDYQGVSSNAKRRKTGQGHSKSLPHKKVGKACQNDFVLARKLPYVPPNEFSPFSKVSDEVILHIFHMLPKSILVKCSAVCKRWRDLSYDEIFWRRYDFGRRLVKPCVLEILLPRGVTVLRLAMSEIKSPIFSGSFNQDSTWYSRLQYLDLSMTTVSANGIADILSVCNQLKKLSVENCVLNEDCCRNIARNTEITVLNMAMCSGLTPASLHLISTQCTKLLEWNLAWTSLTLECMNALLPCVPTAIQRLNLSGHRHSLDDQGLIEVLIRCENLIELDISDCPLLTHDFFEVLLQKCSNLQHLHTSRSYNIPSSSNRLLRDMKNFKKLEIFRTLTDEALAKLRDFMPEIQINQTVFSTIARPTTGIRRTSIWGLRVRD